MTRYQDVEGSVIESKLRLLEDAVDRLIVTASMVAVALLLFFMSHMAIIVYRLMRRSQPPVVKKRSRARPRRRSVSRTSSKSSRGSSSSKPSRTSSKSKSSKGKGKGQASKAKSFATSPTSGDFARKKKAKKEVKKEAKQEVKKEPSAKKSGSNEDDKGSNQSGSAEGKPASARLSAEEFSDQGKNIGALQDKNRSQVDVSNPPMMTNASGIDSLILGNGQQLVPLEVQQRIAVPAKAVGKHSGEAVAPPLGMADLVDKSVNITLVADEPCALRFINNGTDGMIFVVKPPPGVHCTPTELTAPKGESINFVLIASAVLVNQATTLPIRFRYVNAPDSKEPHTVKIIARVVRTL